VVAVEALPDLFKRLQLLQGPDLSPVNKAVSSTDGTAEFSVSQSHNQGSSLKPEIVAMFPDVFGKNVRKISVDLTTIDQLAQQFGHFDVWKLDVEGAEIDALN